MTVTHKPETSIVIRAVNEERWLPEVFDALARQRYRDFEVLLVDSGSIDRTRDIAAANGARIVRLRAEDFTFGHSLNVGVREARGRFIAILSAHAIPANEDWLERLVAPLRSDTVSMVYGGQRGHQISKFSEARDFERLFLEGMIKHHAGALRMVDELFASPGAGQEVDQGTAVNLVISAGPATVAVPDVVCENINPARNEIEGAGLSFQVVGEEFSEECPPNSVARQSPSAGTQVAPGTTVQVWESLGPSPTPPPSPPATPDDED